MERKSRRNTQNYWRFASQRSEWSPSLSVRRWVTQTIISGIIVSILIFIIVNFYVFASLVSLDAFLFVFLVLTFMTDGLFLLFQLARRPVKPRKLSVDPHTVSAVIACYNGEAVIEQTIAHLKRQIPAHQIIVVSDASTDDTGKIARRAGVRVITNKRNMNKAFSVSIGVHAVKTPYVLLLDDDVLIGKATIPTNLMDEGYSAVAFDVMPIKTDTFVNTLQQFEYRNSMHIGKNLRAKADAIGNISGAIGLYRTTDLQEQAYLHSGQFAGEDEQRALLTHLYSTGKGITFSPETVYTHVPNTFHALYRQRAYGWNLSAPEQMILYLRIIFSPRFHFLLKAEKAYYLYIYLTDPLRLLFVWTLVLRPRYLGLTYAAYFVMNFLIWLKTGRKDHFLTVLLYPLYTLWLTLCRFIGNFYWLKVKWVYFRKRYHKLVARRRLVTEFAIVLIILSAAWIVSGLHFARDMRVFTKIRDSRLEETTQSFNYESDGTQKATRIGALNLNFSSTPPAQGSYIAVEVERGDTLRALAHKTVDRYLATRPDLKVPYSQRAAVDQCTLAALKNSSVYFSSSTSTILVSNTTMETVFP